MWAANLRSPFSWFRVRCDEKMGGRDRIRLRFLRNSFFLEIVEDTSGWSRYESQRNPQLIVNTRERRLRNAWGTRDARLSSAILDLASHFGRRGAILYARDSRSVFGLPLRS